MKNIFKVNGKFDLRALILSIIAPFLGSLIVSVMTANSTKLYTQIVKPSFSPPGFIFGIVWPILYLLMGIASYRIYMKKHREGGNAIFFYSIQLILNFLWPILFFSLRLYGLSFIELVILAIFIIVTIYKFFKIDKIAGYLLIPYILWVIFAGVLNFNIWILNEM